MWIAVVIILVSVVLGLIIGLSQKKANDQLVAEGRMIKRNYDFVRKVYVYTTVADFNQIYDKLYASDLSGTGISWRKGNGQIAIESSLGWKAQFVELASEGESHKFQFNFTHWSTRDGIIQETTSMNLLLTAVEKSIISLDSGTKVTTTEQEITSTPKFF